MRYVGVLRPLLLRWSTHVMTSEEKRPDVHAQAWKPCACQAECQDQWHEKATLRNAAGGLFSDVPLGYKDVDGEGRGVT